MKIKIYIILCSMWTLATCLARGNVVIKDGDSIAFLGDSLTQLGYAHQPNGYLHLVIEGLEHAGVQATAIPAGVGGHTTRDMLQRLDRDVISKHPTWMTLNSGINDSPRMDLAEFSANIAEIVDRSTAAGIKVILITTTIGSGENLDSPETAKRKTFAEAFKQLGQERGLIVVDMNTVMARELRKRQFEGIQGLKLTYDGTHLNGLGNQIMAAEILRALGVAESDLAELRAKWNDYPFAVAQPKISLRDYAKMKLLAEENGLSVEAQVSKVLTDLAATGDLPMPSDEPSKTVKLKVMQDWDDSSTNDIKLIELLEKYNAKATFNIIPRTERGYGIVKKINPAKGASFSFVPRDTEGGFEFEYLRTDEMKAIYQGFTLAAHCNFANDDSPRSVESRQRALTETMRWIREDFGQEHVGYVYPGGNYNQTVLEAVRDAGYLYARTTRSVEGALPLDTPMELATSCKWDSSQFWQRYEAAKREGGVFYFWGHSCEMGDDPDTWDKLERIYARIAADPDAEWIDPVDLFIPSESSL
ncbi:GDSL-type esterase/lipase family protein [Coraliomargarita algicola]|uniref:GDSL-type esterase/lipase family protein n=1 Tax=Coraliomargarita algicola TaxID=3092156 RepID=A0ABZ0RQF6_9BACT|nr:GDSL-type esterase/lipase family protein [Coraliomargarita sp. J2-16]WPJ97343.1 GDSL-type esterase/lipase family protein [Coraliomargarita sp. J2-16]